MDRVRLGIIGLGRLGRKHAETVFALPHAELAAVCSVDGKELESAARDLRPARVTSDYRELLRDPGLDGVLIASSSRLHGRMIADALDAGIGNIFVEKPVGISAEDLELVRKAVRHGRGVRIQVGYNRRFDASMRRAKRKLEEGFVGTLVQVRMVNRDPASNAEFIIGFSPASGGLIMDMLTHDYDLARWFTGSEAKSVYGIGEAFVYDGLREAGDIDNASLLVEFRSGVIGQFETSRSCPYGYHVESELYGSEGSLRIGLLPERDRLVSLDRGGAALPYPSGFFEHWEPTFREEIRDFVACIREDRAPVAGLEDGFRAAEWALAATEAVRHRKVVQLD